MRRRRILQMKAQVKAAEAAIAAAKAQIKAGEAAVETAAINISFTRVISPIDGIAGIAQAQVATWSAPAVAHSLQSPRSIPSETTSPSANSDIWRCRKRFQIQRKITGSCSSSSPMEQRIHKKAKFYSPIAR